MSSTVESAPRIRLMLFDVDGVLTDGTVLAARRRQREQAVRHPGRHRAWSGRSGPASRSGCCRRAPRATTPQRAAQLGITLVHQGVPSKLDAYEQILDDQRLTDDDVAYMGDESSTCRCWRASAWRRRRPTPSPRSRSRVALGQPARRRRRRRARAGRAHPARAGSVGRASSRTYTSRRRRTSSA